MTDKKERVDTTTDKRFTQILLVDDDETLVDIATRVLKRLGYRVVGVQSGEEALELFNKQPDTFDLVITDTAMSGMSGYDLSASLNRIRPGTPIIVCSGYIADITQEQAEALGIRAYLSKPFVTEEMDSTIRRVLDDLAV